jgi:hypothetical protein
MNLVYGISKIISSSTEVFSKDNKEIRRKDILKKTPVLLLYRLSTLI